MMGSSVLRLSHKRRKATPGIRAVSFAPKAFAQASNTFKITFGVISLVVTLCRSSPATAEISSGESTVRTSSFMAVLLIRRVPPPPFDVPAPSQFCLRHPAHKPKTRSPPAAPTSVVSYDFGDVFSEKKIAGKAGGQHAAHLQDPLPPFCNWLERERVSDNYISERRNVLVTLGTIGINNSHIFHQAVEVDDAVDRAPKHFRQSVVEGPFIYSFILKFFPAAAVQNVDALHPEAYIFRGQRLYKVLPENVRKPVYQNQCVAPRFRKFQQRVPIQRKTAGAVGLQAVSDCSGKWLETSYRGTAGS